MKGRNCDAPRLDQSAVGRGRQVWLQVCFCSNCMQAEAEEGQAQGAGACQTKGVPERSESLSLVR